MGRDRERSTPLTPQRAFVVQFHADTDLVAGRMVGRVEHVVSGRSQRFSSMASLLAFIENVLSEVNTQRPEGASLEVVSGDPVPHPRPYEGG
jgi:hypothetical protein